jgi:hypothetical protein
MRPRKFASEIYRPLTSIKVYRVFAPYNSAQFNFLTPPFALSTPRAVGRSENMGGGGGGEGVVVIQDLLKKKVLLLKVSNYQKKIILSSHTPKNQQNFPIFLP